MTSPTPEQTAAREWVTANPAEALQGPAHCFTAGFLAGIQFAREWKPIEEAAIELRDGRDLMGVDEDGRQFVMQCYAPPLGTGRWLSGGEEAFPTHFRLLDPPPGQEG